MLETLNLDGKSVAITGGGTGLGLAMVRAMARAGANIAIAGRRQKPIDDAAAEVMALGRDALAVSTDVADSAQVDRFIQATIDRFGRIDVLLNNSGTVDEGHLPIWEISDAEWHRVLDVNLTGAFYCARAASRPMMEQGKGKIINVASGFGMRGGRDITIYCSSKGGLIQLTRALSFNLARYGITVNTIIPGFVPTEITIITTHTRIIEVKADSSCSRFKTSSRCKKALGGRPSTNNFACLFTARVVRIIL